MSWIILVDLLGGRGRTTELVLQRELIKVYNNFGARHHCGIIRRIGAVVSMCRRIRFNWLNRVGISHLFRGQWLAEFRSG